jgi:hypothetical protein
VHCVSEEEMAIKNLNKRVGAVHKRSQAMSML